MTRVAARLARLEAAVPRPVPPVEYDLSRLTPAQLWRMGELRGRLDEVGLSGLTDGELDELAEMTEILLARETSEGRP